MHELLEAMFCIPIDGEDAKCHPDMGDGRMTYNSEKNDYYIFERNGNWYVVPERDSKARYKGAISWTRFKELEAIFGDDFKPVSELPAEETKLEE